MLTQLSCLLKETPPPFPSPFSQVSSWCCQPCSMAWRTKWVYAFLCHGCRHAAVIAVIASMESKKLIGRIGQLRIGQLRIGQLRIG